MIAARAASAALAREASATPGALALLMTPAFANCRENTMRLLVLLCMLAPLAAQADLFKCTDQAGKVTYTNLPCAKMGLTETKVIPPPPPLPVQRGKPASAAAEKASIADSAAENRPGTRKKEKPARAAHPQESNNKKCAKLRDRMGRIMDQMDAARRHGYTAKQETDWDNKLRQLQAEKNRLDCF